MGIKQGFICAIGTLLGTLVFQTAVFAGECTAEIGKVAYSGSFSLPDANGRTEKMIVKVGQSLPGETIADLYVGNDCKATCRLKVFPQSGAPQPAASDFTCNGAFTAPATLFWSEESPAIRFGTWLEGYQQVSLENIHENSTLLASLTGFTEGDRIPASQAKSNRLK